MSLWFAYNGMDYYPFARVVEAATAEEAAAMVRDQGDVGGRDPIAVFPLEALAYRHDGEDGPDWLERFDP